MATYFEVLNQEIYLWDAEIEQITFEAFEKCCPFCSTNISNVKKVRAHIFPVGSGVGFKAGNIVLSCYRCNSLMKSLNAWQWCEQEGIPYAWIVKKLEEIKQKCAGRTLFLRTQLGLSSEEQKALTVYDFDSPYDCEAPVSIGGKTYPKEISPVLYQLVSWVAEDRGRLLKSTRALAQEFFNETGKSVSHVWIQLAKKYFVVKVREQ